MTFTPLDPSLSISPQLSPQDIARAANDGFRVVVCNRPDGEDPDQPAAADVAAAARAHGMTFVHLPVGGTIGDADVAAMTAVLAAAPGPVLAYCRSGSRSTRIGAAALAARQAQRSADPVAERFDVVIVGGGAAGIATASSLLRRRRSLRIAIVDPADHHHYQPGWTMVGAGIFSRGQTTRAMADVMPAGITWLKAKATAFDAAADRIRLADGRHVDYRALVVATGLTLDWGAIPGLEDALGRNGVTSNYRGDLAPYTADLVRRMTHGRAIFTQPPMPIKCAGAPQKAMYLSCDSWRRAGRSNGIDVAFHTATPALFGVAAYVPALMRYIERYGVDLKLGSRLVAINGANQTATFERTTPDGETITTAERFDMIHVCPPQVAPAEIANSPIAGAGGFVEVDPATLRHLRYGNVFALGDVAATSNAKTAAAARKQAPVVAANVLATLEGVALPAVYDGYGSCPLTVERGRIVLAEFGYGGTLLPSFPRWLLDGRRPSRLAWFLKAHFLPWLYWHGMLKGREWLAAPVAPRG